MPTPLISVNDAHALLGRAVIVDCRFDLANPGAGETVFMAGHIPGAVYAHLDRDLSAPKASRTGRHPLPNPENLAITLGRFGISNASHVIVYDADNGMFAARLWWLLRWLGHDNVQVLDGGFKSWQAAGLPTTTAIERPPVASFTPRVRSELVVSAEDVARLVRVPDWRVLDARAPERFRGDVEPIDPVAGHIPGARNHPFAMNLKSDATFLSPAELKQKLTASLDGVAPEHTIMMCGSGVTACHNVVAMIAAGLAEPKLYAGSWSEWITDSARPIAKG